MVDKEQVGRRFSQGFLQLREEFPDVLQEVRQKGLMIGLQFASEAHGPLMTRELAREGVLAIFSGNDTSVMRLMPSLVISELEVDEVRAALRRAMAGLKET